MDCNLIDIGFSGNNFTWNHGNLWQRLDHVLFNDSWIKLFNSIHVEHLSRTLSDHSPILITLKPRQVSSLPKFRFQNMWLLDDSFLNMVHENWVAPLHLDDSIAGMNRLWLKLKRLNHKINWWNRNVFKNVFTNILNAEDKFENVSGLYLNKHKSYFIAFKKVPNDRINAIKNLTGFFQEKNIHFDDLITAIKNKLMSWDSKFMSFGGGLTLIKSILCSLHVYIFQTLLPTCVSPLFKLFTKDLARVFWQPASHFSWRKLEERVLSLRGERVELEREKSLGEGVWRGFYTVVPASSHRSTSKSWFVLREVFEEEDCFGVKGPGSLPSSGGRKRGQDLASEASDQELDKEDDPDRPGRRITIMPKLIIWGLIVILKFFDPLGTRRFEIVPDDIDRQVKSQVLAEVLYLHHGVVKKEEGVLCLHRGEVKKGSVAVLCHHRGEVKKGRVTVLCRRKEEGFSAITVERVTPECTRLSSFVMQQKVIIDKEDLGNFLHLRTEGDRLHTLIQEAYISWSLVNDTLRGNKDKVHQPHVYTLLRNARIIQHVLRSSIIPKAGDHVNITPLLSLVTHLIMTNTPFDEAQLILDYIHSLSDIRHPQTKRKKNIALGHLVCYILEKKYNLIYPEPPTEEPIFFTNASFRSLFHDPSVEGEDSEGDKEAPSEPAPVPNQNAFHDIIQRFDTMETNFGQRFDQIDLHMKTQEDRHNLDMAWIRGQTDYINQNVAMINSYFTAFNPQPPSDQDPGA
ncbi:hypothetical protein M5K25_022216 [Dendrobium thyrsiflorum]|uniref:Uncharacterized protein n=1 Tax=Dendrobium thyrsiflorum TaxID=117978 RepID=A0ABD0U5W3_DENTH